MYTDREPVGLTCLKLDSEFESPVRTLLDRFLVERIGGSFGGPVGLGGSAGALALRTELLLT